MKLISIAPCQGWYYVGPVVEGRPIVFHVASWAVTEDGLATGLVAVHSTENAPVSLALPPPIGGTYKVEAQLTEDERAAASRG